tara:strand:- start:133 stop:549 length:417 start_codon:yes stop_codon:yes gene_type:complete
MDMEIKERYTESACREGGAATFFNSLGSQLGGIFGLGTVVDHSGIDVMKKLADKIKELQSQLKTVEWQCTQKLVLEQDKTNEKRLEAFDGLKNYINENNNYLSHKYVFEIERLGLLEGAISILTTLVVFIILNFLKFK